jgi:hypothetical protein
VNVLIGAIAAGVCLWAVTESRDEERHRLDLVGTARVTGALSGLVVAVIGTSSHPWTSARTIGLLVAGAALLCSTTILSRSRRRARWRSALPMW